MNKRKSVKDSKGKKIRKILLINSDIEMQKKVKAKNHILINSMTPLELENLFKLSKEPINITFSTITNILEKHMIQRIVDIPNNINFFYSDTINEKNTIKKVIKKKFQGKNSAKNFIVNYEKLIEKKENNNNKKEEIFEQIIPFASKKKSVGEEKIKGTKSYHLIAIGQQNIFQMISKDFNKNNIRYSNDIDSNNNDNISEKDNNENEDKNLNSLCFSNSSIQTESDKFDKNIKSKEKPININNKLIYYCYTYLKRKRPLMTRNSNNTTIYGLEIEEEVFKKHNTIKNLKKCELKKKRPVRPINKLKCKSCKEVKVYNQINSSKIKKEEKHEINNKEIKILKSRRKSTNSEKISEKDNINISTKDFIYKKKRGKTLTDKISSNNGSVKTKNKKSQENIIKALKIIAKKIHTIRSEKNEKISKKISQNIKLKRRAHSIVKKSKNNNDIKNQYYKKYLNLRVMPSLNIISKADTKNSSFDNITSEEYSSIQNKNKKIFNINHNNKKKGII